MEIIFQLPILGEAMAIWIFKHPIIHLFLHFAIDLNYKNK